MKRLRGGDPRARILQKVVREEGHWHWTGAKDSSGYGSFWLEGKTVAAHRAVYSLAFGVIPDGLEIDHICRVPSCVRPSHLRAVSHAENMRNTDRATRESCVSGHPLSDSNVYTVRGRRCCRACNKEAARRYKARQKDGAA